VTPKRRACRRCETPLVGDAKFCHTCGDAVASAASGEFTLYDLDRFFNYALDMLCIAGTDGYFKRVNPSFERTLGWTADEMLETPFVELIHPDDRGETLAEIGRLATGMPTLSFENRYRCKDGSYKHLHWTSYPEPGTGLLYAVARDVTEWRRRETRIDGLTGTFSRRVFEETLPAEWRRARRQAVPLAVSLVDVDRFRDFNRRYGHQAGDDCLRRVAVILYERTRRAGDMVARFGGGEFVLILQGGGDAVELSEEIRAAVESLGIPHEGSSAGGHVTVSVGVAERVPDESGGASDLLSAAQSALEEAKQRGRNRVVAGRV